MNDLWTPLWRTNSVNQHPVLQGTLEVEFAIVGAGLEGLSLALELARAKKTVAVLEAADIGNGATGASAGIVTAQLVRQTPDDVVRRLGRAQAELFLKLLASAGARTFELIGARKRQVGAVNGGFIAPAKGAAGAERIATSAQQWLPFRSDLRVLSARETLELTGAVGYSAALLDPSGGCLNPLAYAEMLASDVRSLGAAIYTHSPVRCVTRSSSSWRVDTGHGSITARQVVLCANGGNAALATSLRHSVLPLSVCQVATVPMSAKARQDILPRGQSMTDLETDVFSVRFDPEGRLITAYPMSSALKEPGRLNELVNRRLAAMLPSFLPTRLQHAWTGTAWLNSDLLPRAVDLDEGLFAIQACNGRGIAVSAAVGQSFGSWLTQGGNGPCAIPVQRPRSIPGYALVRYVPAVLMRLSLAAQRLRRALAC